MHKVLEAVSHARHTLKCINTQTHTHPYRHSLIPPFCHHSLLLLLACLWGWLCCAGTAALSYDGVGGGFSDCSPQRGLSNSKQQQQKTPNLSSGSVSGGEAERDSGAAATLSAWTSPIRKERQTLGSVAELGRQTKRKKEKSRQPRSPQD